MLDTKYKSSYIRGMNKLPLKTRSLILHMLCEGQSMRATARLADVSFNTVAKLLIDAGTVCADLHDEHVQGVPSGQTLVQHLVMLQNPIPCASLSSLRLS